MNLLVLFSSPIRISGKASFILLLVSSWPTSPLLFLSLTVLTFKRVRKPFHSIIHELLGSRAGCVLSEFEISSSTVTTPVHNLSLLVIPSDSPEFPVDFTPHYALSHTLSILNRTVRTTAQNGRTKVY